MLHTRISTIGPIAHHNIITRERTQVTGTNTMYTRMDNSNEWLLVSKCEQGSWTDIQRDRCSDPPEYSQMEREITRSRWKATEQREPRATKTESVMYTSIQSMEPTAGNRAISLVASLWGWLVWVLVWFCTTRALNLLGTTRPILNSRNMAYNTTRQVQC